MFEKGEFMLNKNESVQAKKRAVKRLLGNIGILIPLIVLLIIIFIAAIGCTVGSLTYGPGSYVPLVVVSEIVAYIIFGVLFFYVVRYMGYRKRFKKIFSHYEILQEYSPRYKNTEYTRESIKDELKKTKDYTKVYDFLASVEKDYAELIINNQNNYQKAKEQIQKDKLEEKKNNINKSSAKKSDDRFLQLTNYANSKNNTFEIKDKYQFKAILLTIYNNVRYLENKRTAKAVKNQLKSAYNNNNIEEVNSILQKYSFSSVLDSKVIGESKFKGTLVKYCLHKVHMAILNFFLLRWLTLGIISYHGVVVDTKYQVNNTIIDGHKLKFRGNFLQVWWMNFKNFLLNVITLGIYGLVNKKFKGEVKGANAQKWAASKTRIAGENAVCLGTYTGSAFKLTLLKILAFIGSLCTLFICRTYFSCLVARYRINNTVYDGKRLYFDGTGKQLFAKNLLWALLTICTLFIYSFVAKYKIEKWITEHTHFAPGVNLSKKIRDISLLTQNASPVEEEIDLPVDINKYPKELKIAQQTLKSSPSKVLKVSTSRKVVAATIPVICLLGGSIFSITCGSINYGLYKLELNYYDQDNLNRFTETLKLGMDESDVIKFGEVRGTYNDLTVIKNFNISDFEFPIAYAKFDSNNKLEEFYGLSKEVNFDKQMDNIINESQMAQKSMSTQLNSITNNTTLDYYINESLNNTKEVDLLGYFTIAEYRAGSNGSIISDENEFNLFLKKGNVVSSVFNNDHITYTIDYSYTDLVSGKEVKTASRQDYKFDENHDLHTHFFDKVTVNKGTTELGYVINEINKNHIDITISSDYADYGKMISGFETASLHFEKGYTGKSKEVSYFRTQLNSITFADDIVLDSSFNFDDICDLHDYLGNEYKNRLFVIDNFIISRNEYTSTHLDPTKAPSFFNRKQKHLFFEENSLSIDYKNEVILNLETTIGDDDINSLTLTDDCLSLYGNGNSTATININQIKLRMYGNPFNINPSSDNSKLIVNYKGSYDDAKIYFTEECLNFLANTEGVTFNCNYQG